MQLSTLNTERFHPSSSSCGNGEAALTEDERPAAQLDLIPFALLTRRYAVALSIILRETPHILEASDLYSAGCSIKQLKNEGAYSEEELVDVKGRSYRHINTLHDLTSGLHSVKGSSNLLVSACVDKDLQLWCTETGENKKTWKGHNGSIYKLVTLRDGTVITAGADLCIKRWNPTTSECLASIENAHTSWVWTIAALQDGRVISGGHDSGNQIKIWNMDTRQCEMVLEGHEWGISSLVQLSSGLVASGSHDCKIRLWNLEAVHEHERCVQVLEGHRGVVSALEQLGNGLLASGSWDGSIRLWRLNSPAAGAAPSPSAECILVLEGHRRCVLCMCVLSDGITLMSGSDDNTVKLWNTRTGECINTLNGHTDYVHSVSALADNKTIASCANDGTVRFWQF